MNTAKNISFPITVREKVQTDNSSRSIREIVAQFLETHSIKPRGIQYPTNKSAVIVTEEYGVLCIKPAEWN